jgi:hypothetical protein
MPPEQNPVSNPRAGIIMAEEQRPESIQLNMAPNQRNALRDYYEFNENRIPDSIRLYLATTPTERLDKEAIDNERLFAFRFGFDATQTVRAQVIAYKRQYGFTDRQLRGLRLSGQLRVRHTEATLASDAWVMWSGWVQLGIFTLVFLAMVFQITFSSAPMWKQDLALAVLLALWFGVAWGINKLYIAPWRLLRRVGVM